MALESSHGLVVVINGRRLVDGLTLPAAAYRPQPGWRFAIGARCTSAVDRHSIRNVGLSTGRLLTGGDIAVDATLNGDDYELGVTFTYFRVEHVTPTLGPAAGGTLVRLNGTALLAGVGAAEPACRFGAVEVRASVRNGTSELECISPATALAATVPLTLSLNGIGHRLAANFSYFAPPSVTRIFPASGSRHGGALVHVYGEHLSPGPGAHDGARSPLCRFGGAPSRAGGGDGADGADGANGDAGVDRGGPIEVEATAVGEGGTELRCLAPRLEALVPVPLSISLNGQEYTADAVTWSPLEALEVLSVHPSSGPVEGGTNVSVVARGLASGTAFSCRFGNLTLDALVEPPPASLASIASAATLVCVAPSQLLNLTGVPFPIDNSSSSSPAEDAAALVGATGAPNGTNASLVLFLDGNATNTTNATAFNATNATHATLDGLPAEAAPAAFEWPLSAYWPALPFGVGVEVSANGVDYSAAEAPRLFTFLEPIAASLPAPLPPVGPLRGATIIRIDGVPTRGASRAACRFGALPSDDDASNDAASTGGGSGGSGSGGGDGGGGGGGGGGGEDGEGGGEHVLEPIVVNATIVGDEGSPARALLCQTPPMAAAVGTAVPIALSLNAQQWAPTTSRFRVVQPAQVLSVLPEITPNSGGLVLELSGAHLDGGSDYRCRFGRRAVVPATHDAQSSSVLCVSPAGLLGHVTVAVSLNGQQFSEQDQPEAGSLIMYYDADGFLTEAELDAAGMPPKNVIPVL